ncbi:MAG: GNAT family N-acetyltransferase [Planctomycetaceae bacterium]|nr:GNAT family N-acetyltransferase [Planctomycetaceae bacterium]
MSFSTRLMLPSDGDEVAELIFNSLNVWHEKNRGFKLVPGTWEILRIFPRVYEALDPNCCVTVVDTETNRIAGACFFHPRSTHTSLGILAVHPDFFGKRAGSMLVKYIADFTDRRNQPLRLVSGATNIDSFSLYSKFGFVPECFYQDVAVAMYHPVEVNAPDGTEIRDATPDDVPAIAALERRITGLDREKDYRFFLENTDKIWHTSVMTSSAGIIGVMASVCDPGSNMLGPGVAQTEEQAAALIRHELNAYHLHRPVVLIPSAAIKLRQALYDIGGKNCDLHISQVRQPGGKQAASGRPCFPPSSGLVFPTFMPESG